VGTTHGVYLLHGEFVGFHSVFVFLLRRWLERQEENFPFCSGHLPAENLLESSVGFVRGEDLPLTHTGPERIGSRQKKNSAILNDESEKLPARPA
jgi:hypothetical protein